MNIRDKISKSYALLSTISSNSASEVESFLLDNDILFSENKDLRNNSLSLSINTSRYLLDQNEYDLCIKFIMLGRHFTRSFLESADLELIALDCFFKKGDRDMALDKLKILNVNKNDLNSIQTHKLSGLREQILQGY